MTTKFDGGTFSLNENRTFAPTFEGAQSRRDRAISTLIGRRHLRRDRRSNRAI